MKKGLILIVLTASIITILLLNHCKKNNVFDTNLQPNKEQLIKNMNKFLPSEDVEERYKLIKAFQATFNTIKSGLKDGITFEDKSAELARYEMETSLLNDSALCFIHDSTVFFAEDTVFDFTLENVDFDESGKPIICGDDMLDKYSDLGIQMTAFNNSGSYVISIMIRLIDYDQDETEFQATMSLATSNGYNGCGMQIISPSQDPVLFPSSYYAYMCTHSPNAPSNITTRLNPNSGTVCDCPTGVAPFIEYATSYEISWNSGAGYRIMWAGTSCYYADGDELNDWLELYKELADDLNPSGYNDLWAYRCTIGTTHCSTPYWWNNQWIYHYHYMIEYIYQVTCLPYSPE